jgi:AsmA protein
MRKTLKIILYVISVFLVIILVTVLSLPFIVNPNDFKPQIERLVKEKIGRTLTIEGDLKLSIFPWLGISTGKISLSNAPGFDNPYFAQIQQSEINVKLLPLFTKQLDVSEIVFKGLSLHLSKNKQGINNWDDFKNLSKNESKKTTSPLAIFAIAGLSIENATITWDDLQKNQHNKINNLQVKVGKLNFNQKIPLNISLIFVNQQPLMTQLLNFSGNLTLTPSLEIFELNEVKIDLVTRSESIPAGSLTLHLVTDALFNKPQQYLRLSGLKIKSGDLKVKAELACYFKESTKINLTVGIENFNVVKFLQKMKLKQPKMADENALTHLELDFKLQANTKRVNINELVLKVDESTLKGLIKVSDFENPSILFDLLIDKVNLDRYLPRKDNHFKKMITPASAAVIGVSLAPVEILKTLNASGKIVIEQLKVNELKMQGITLKLDAEKGIIQSNQVIKKFYKGQYQGGFNLNVNAKKPIFILDEKFNNVHIAPLLKDIKGESRIKGLVNMNAQLTGYGNTAQIIKSSLKGQLKFLFKEGVISDFNIPQWLNQGKSLLNGANSLEINNNETPIFSKISATAYINEGLIQNNNLLGVSSKIKLTGQGYANLITEELNYKINLLRIKQQATKTTPEILSSQPIIINVVGNFNNPHYKINLAAMLLEKNHDKIDKLLNKINKNIPAKIGNFLMKIPVGKN